MSPERIIVRIILSWFNKVIIAEEFSFHLVSRTYPVVNSVQVVQVLGTGGTGAGTGAYCDFCEISKNSFFTEHLRRLLLLLVKQPI